MGLLKGFIWLFVGFFVVILGVAQVMILFLDCMMKDIHTHRLTIHRDSELWSCSYKDRSALYVQQAVHISVGIHPWYITDEDYSAQQEWVVQMLRDPRVIALGEGGLDKLCATPMMLQEKAFRWLIERSEENRLPLIIHCVKCTSELLRLKKEYKPVSPWIIHGFRGKPQQASEYLRHGLYLSYGERYAVEALRQTPVERLFLETDESNIEIEELYKRVADCREISLKTLKDSVIENINRVFY